jgi:hypothetical protein
MMIIQLRKKKYSCCLEDNLSTQNSRGLCVLNLEIINMSLLAKWLFIYLDSQVQGLWKSVLLAKYTHSSYRTCYSPFWKAILSTKTFMDINVDKKVGYGHIVSF